MRHTGEIAQDLAEQGFSGKSIDPDHIKQRVLEEILSNSYPAGQA